jgi:hypothetical protein
MRIRNLDDRWKKLVLYQHYNVSRFASRQRIVRLLEAKHTAAASPANENQAAGSSANEVEEAAGMISLTYNREADTTEIIEIDVNSFVVVASVAYLMRISDFFIPKEVIDYETIMAGIVGDEKDAGNRSQTPPPQQQQQQPPLRKILFRMAEPDIILVNDIDDLGTDAIMINAELTLNLFQKPEKLSMQLILDNLRQRNIYTTENTNLLEGLVARSNSLLVFLIIYIYTHIFPFITFVEFRTSFLIAVRSVMGLEIRAEIRTQGRLTATRRATN